MFKVRTHESKTISWWYSNKEAIDFEPPYQRRGNLWPTPIKAYLIDSIINEYDIPKIYLADFTIVNTNLNRNNLPYAVIDGRQRLESIFGFYEDKFTLNADFIYYPDPSLKLAGLIYSDLKKNYPKIASIFEQFNLHVMSVITDDLAKINDLFVRLNTSRSLTGAELRNAMMGVVPDLIRNICSHKFFVDNIAFSTNRGADKNTVAKLLLIEFRGKFVDTKRVHLDRFVEEGIKSETSDFSQISNKVISILDSMNNVFAPRDILLKSQGPIPIYYWLIRTYGPKQNIREFLVRFEGNRKKNSVLAKNYPADADQELLSYDVLSRSINDQTSLQKMFQILESKYLEFNAAFSEKLF